jgi:hypothetical protein
MWKTLIEPTRLPNQATSFAPAALPVLLEQCFAHADGIFKMIEDTLAAHERRLWHPFLLALTWRQAKPFWSSLAFFSRRAHW